MSRRGCVALMLLSIAAAGCSGSSGTPDRRGMSALNQVSADQWASLAHSTIYFGHQSVGNNILEAARDLLREHPQIPIRIVSGSPVAAAGVLNEFVIGENGDPQSKNASFLSVVERNLGPRPILMLKYCYVDIDVRTNVDAVFQQYQETISRIKAKHPDATIVHVTVPLVTHSAVRDAINGVLGRPTRPMRNAQRSRYNELLRAAYGGKEPIYDLAAVEARRADGSEEVVSLGDRRVYALAPEWAADDGHLNAAGRRHAAEAMLATLALVAARAQAPAPR